MTWQNCQGELCHVLQSHPEWASLTCVLSYWLWPLRDLPGSRCPFVTRRHCPLETHACIRTWLWDGVSSQVVYCMGSFSLKNSCHPVWQRVKELVDEVVGDGTEGHLAGIPKLLQVLRLRLPSFLFHSSADMLNPLAGNVLRGKNLLIFGTINVTIHLTDLPGTSVLDVTPNHNLSTSKFDCLLGEP